MLVLLALAPASAGPAGAGSLSCIRCKRQVWCVGAASRGLCAGKQHSEEVTCVAPHLTASVRSWASGRLLLPLMHRVRTHGTPRGTQPCARGKWFFTWKYLMPPSQGHSEGRDTQGPPGVWGQGLARHPHGGGGCVLLLPGHMEAEPRGIAHHTLRGLQKACVLTGFLGSPALLSALLPSL